MIGAAQRLNWVAGNNVAPRYRRCESIDEAMNLVMEASDLRPVVSFPQNIKTVTAATIMKGPEDYTAGLQVSPNLEKLDYAEKVAIPSCNLFCCTRRQFTCGLTTLATQNLESPGLRADEGSTTWTGSRSAPTLASPPWSSGT